MTPVAPRLRGLVLASHPGPSVVVTAVVTLLAAAAGAPARTCLGVALVVLLGQVSVGWCNDAVDAAADVAAGRSEKPVVRGLVSAALLWKVAPVALALAVLLSPVLLGAVGGTAHISAVLAAWAYDLGLKDTRWSPLPYAVAFGMVPVVAAGVARQALPPVWAVTAAAALGIGAHLANTAREVPSDVAVGRGGLAVRLGERRARLAAVLAFGVGVVLVLVAVAPPAVALVLAAGQVAALVAAATLARGRHLFGVLLLVVGVDAVLLVVLGVGWV
jgi:4-hydroxybenzoate polyprenyltransferase